MLHQHTSLWLNVNGSWTFYYYLVYFYYIYSYITVYTGQSLPDSKRPSIVAELQKLATEWPLEVVKRQKEESRKVNLSNLWFDNSIFIFLADFMDVLLMEMPYHTVMFIRNWLALYKMAFLSWSMHYQA